MGEFHAAIEECYDKILDVEHNNIEAQILKAQCYYKVNDKENSLITYDKILEIDPLNLDALYEKGVILKERGEYQRAIEECFDEVLSLEQNEINSLNGKAVCLYNLQQYEESLKIYETILSIEPRNIMVWENIGYPLQALKRYKEAWTAYRRSEKYKNLQKRK